MGILSGIFKVRDKPANATAGSGYRFLFGTSGKNVTGRSAMRATAVYSRVRILAEAIASIFRVPPHMVGDLEKSGFSNIGQQSLEFVIIPCDQTTEGNVIHCGYIEKFIERPGERFNIREIAFDRWGAVQMIQNLEGTGFTAIPFGWGFKDMSPPAKELMKLALEQRMAHGGHPVLRWMMDNIYIQQGPAGNIKADKEKSTEKVDGAIAAIMGLDRANRRGNQNRESVCDSRGSCSFNLANAFREQIGPIFNELSFEEKEQLSIKEINGKVYLLKPDIDRISGNGALKKLVAGDLPEINTLFPPDMWIADFHVF